METLAVTQLYSMLTIFFGVDEWTPSSERIGEIAQQLGRMLMLMPQTIAQARARFEENVNGRRDYIRCGGKLQGH